MFMDWYLFIRFRFPLDIGSIRLRLDDSKNYKFLFYNNFTITNLNLDQFDSDERSSMFRYVNAENNRVQTSKFALFSLPIKYNFKVFFNSLFNH